MHRWSTNSWVGLNAVPGCEILLQTSLPSEALQHNYLLNGIFALGAIDLARHASDAKLLATYRCAALEYGSRASEEFRVKLGDAKPQDVHLLYYFATLASVLNFAMMPGRYDTALDGLDVSLHLFLGSFRIAGSNLDWLYESPCSLALAVKYLPMSPTLIDELESDTQIAIARISSLSKIVRVPVRRPQQREQHQPDKPAPFASEVNAYQVAIKQIKYSFAQDITDLVKGFFLTVVAVGGREFAGAVYEREPMALFIMMYWSVLMDRAGRYGMMWWVGSTGRDLVEEISHRLQTSSIGYLEDVYEGIKWKKREVNLPPLPSVEPPTLLDSVPTSIA